MSGDTHIARSWLACDSGGCDVTYLVRTTGKRNAFLKEALESIKAQSVPCELVLVIDGPGREAALSSVRLQVPSYLPYVCIPSAAGSMPGAWNVGMDHVDGKYVCALDDDDVVYPHHAEVLRAALEKDESAGVAYGRVVMMRCDQNNKPLHERMEWGRPFTLEQLRRENRIPNHGAMTRTELMRKFPSEEEDGPCHDWATWLRLASSGVKFVSVDSRVAEYRVRSEDGSNGFGRGQMEEAAERVRRRWGVGAQ
jgi:glycosyltransferase involved in cell wall biosynthesis